MLCLVGDLSAFQIGDGLGHACSAEVSRLFWVSTADVTLCEYCSTVPRYEGITSSCLMK
jgi:hypothetical protein